MDNIKIIRLQSGEDVIASYTEDKEGFVFLSNPMLFIVKRNMNTKSSVFLSHWLPIDVIENNVAQITRDDILFLINPTEQFKQYYFKMIFEEYNGEGSYEGPDDFLDDNSDDLYDDDYTEYNDEEEQQEVFSIFIEGNKTKH